MTPSELTAHVTRRTCAASVALAVPAAWLAGAEGGVGVLAGGAMAVGAFRWIAARVIALTATGSAARALWVMGSGLRFTGIAAIAALLLATGWAHPVGLLVGVTLMPVGVLALGWRAAGEES